MVFSKKIFVADSNEIAVSYRMGWIEFRHRESFPVIDPRFVVWESKIAKNMSFFSFFVNFS
jgi:hypothetical protein